jgi:probable HAF family extracellular repeat protein
MSATTIHTLSAVLALALAAASAAVSAAPPPRYAAVPLRVDARESYASGINASGDVAGKLSSTGWDIDGAFLFVGGAMQPFPPLVEIHLASGIGDDGQVAGHDGWSPFIYSAGEMRYIDAPGAGQVDPLAMGPDGAVAGSVWFSNAKSRAFRYVGGVFEDLGTLGGLRGVALGINRAGEVTGTSSLADGSLRAFIYAGGAMRSLGTIGGKSSAGAAINAFGQVTGADGATIVNEARAFLYADGAMLDLGTLDGGESYGLAINTRGDVTGKAKVGVPPSLMYRAFLHTDGTMYDLNSLVVSGLDGFELYEATGINDHGQIAANGCSVDGCIAFRLDPVPVALGQVVEYHHAAFDHYFVTADADEIAKLDRGAFAGWARTGQAFNVHLDAPSATKLVCRFFSTAFDPKSSHFYTADLDECVKVRSNASWRFEKVAFNVAVPDADGRCPPDSEPVYRLYNGGKGGAPNHRFTAIEAVRSQMIGAGWIPEGAGALGVGMCAPK